MKTSGAAKARLASRTVFILFLMVQAILWYGAGIRAVGKLSPRVFFGTMKGTLTAATFFWGAIFLLSLVLGPVYCGWVCAFGSYQDVVCGLLPGRPARDRGGIIGDRVDRVKAIRYIKYVLLAFLLGRAVVDAVRHPTSKFVLRMGMPAPFDGMANPGTLAWVLGTALLVYLLGSRAWCSYVCPFGAAISVLSIVAPYRVRVVGECKDCGLCDRACPSRVLAWKPRD
ncbi:MAG: 4Fe-4S binding protein [Ignavibacteriales bacterium]